MLDIMEMGLPSWQANNGRPSPLTSVPHRDVFYRQFTNSETRRTIAQLYNTYQCPDALDLILEAIKLGLHGNAPSPAVITQPVLRLALPFLRPKREYAKLDLRKPETREFARMVLFPLLQTCPELRDPARCEELEQKAGTFKRWNSSFMKQVRAEAAAAAQAAAAQAAAAQAAPMAQPKPVEPPPQPSRRPDKTLRAIDAYGCPLWRSDLPQPYTLADVRAAIAFASSLIAKLSSTHSPQDIAALGNDLLEATGREGVRVAAGGLFEAYQAKPTGDIRFAETTWTSDDPGWED